MPPISSSYVEIYWRNRIWSIKKTSAQPNKDENNYDFAASGPSSRYNYSSSETIFNFLYSDTSREKDVDFFNNFFILFLRFQRSAS